MDKNTYYNTRVIPLLMIVFSMLAHGVYQAINLNVAFVICPEYFISYMNKYLHAPNYFGNANVELALAGIIDGCTWGLLIGMILLYFTKMTGFNRRFFLTSIGLIHLTAFAFGIAGIIYGKLILTTADPEIYIPPSVIDTNGFYTIHYMQTLDTIGLFVGLIPGIFFLVYKKSKAGTSVSFISVNESD